VVRTEEGLRKGLKMLGALEREDIIDEKGAVFASKQRIYGMADGLGRFREKSQEAPISFLNILRIPILSSQDPMEKIRVIQNQSGKR
jgi:hypothetical protein